MFTGPVTLTLLRNGRIHTAADPDATAMAISDSTISWIGGEHAVALAGAPDRVIDLDGALVIPGFVDAHVHTTDAGLALTGLDLSGTRSLAECLAALRRHRRGPPGRSAVGARLGGDPVAGEPAADPGRGGRRGRQPARRTCPGSTCTPR